MQDEQLQAHQDTPWQVAALWWPLALPFAVILLLWLERPAWLWR